MKLPTRLLSAVAAATLLSLTAACGAGASDGESRASAVQENATGGGGESRSASGSGAESGAGSDARPQGGADRSEICRKAQQALQRFTDKAASAIGDHAAYNKATEELSTELRDLAGKADGELKSTLTSMARAWGDFTIDTSDLTQSANKLTEATRQIGEQTRNLVTACT